MLLSSLLQVLNGAILQQVFVVEFVIQSQMCDDCHRVEAKDFWKAVVQVRQKVHDCCLMDHIYTYYLFHSVPCGCMLIVK